MRTGRNPYNSRQLDHLHNVEEYSSNPLHPASLRLRNRIFARSVSFLLSNAEKTLERK